MLQKNSVIKENVDIEEAIDEAGHGRYNYFMLATCCMISIGCTMDMLGYSIIVPAASCDLNLTLQQSANLKSISFAGFLFAVPWGYTADNVGRKKTIFIGAVAGSLFSVAASFSISYYMMMVLKFFACFFSAAAISLITTYLGESTCRKERNKFIFIQNIFNTGTDLILFVLSYFILPLNIATPMPYLNVFKSWRLLSLLISLPLGLGAILIMFVKETPKFLYEKGQTDKAMDVLETIYRSNNGNKCMYPVKSILKTDSPVENISCGSSLMSQLAVIFKPPLLWKSLQLILILSVCCSTNNVFFMWFPSMANSFFSSVDETSTFCQKVVANITPVTDDVSDVCLDSYSVNTIYSGMILTSLTLSFNIGALFLANWRKTLINSVLLAACVSCIALNLITDRIASMILFSVVQFTVLAIGSVYAYYVDVFPTSCRGLATSLGTTVARTAGLAGVSIVGSTVTNYCQLTFYSWALFIFCGIVTTMFLRK